MKKHKTNKLAMIHQVEIGQRVKRTLADHPNYTKQMLRDSLIKAGFTDLRYSGKERAFYALKPAA